MKKLKKIWQHSKFLISAVLLAAPAAISPFYFQTPIMSKPAHIIADSSINDVSFILGEVNTQKPELGPSGEWVKEYALSFKNGDGEKVRAAYLKMGEPNNFLQIGNIFQGGPYYQISHTKIPPFPRAGTDLWLTIETWDGQLHSRKFSFHQSSQAMKDLYQEWGGQS